MATLPVSAGPVYVFLALDHDATFISVSAVVSLALNAATAVFVTVYVLMARRRSLWSACSGIYGLARGHFGARSCSLECPSAFVLNLVFIRPLLVDRQTVLPGTHAVDDTALYHFMVRAGMVTLLVGAVVDPKFSNWSDGKRRACCIPDHLHKYYGDVASPRRRSRHSRSASERRSRPCRIWRSAANAASHSSATWISPSPHCCPRCLRCLECLLICDTALQNPSPEVHSRQSEQLKDTGHVCGTFRT